MAPRALRFRRDPTSVSGTSAAAGARRRVDGGPADSPGSWSKRRPGETGGARTGVPAVSVFLEEAAGIWKQRLGSYCVAHGRINMAPKESIRDN